MPNRNGNGNMPSTGRTNGDGAELPQAGRNAGPGQPSEKLSLHFLSMEDHLGMVCHNSESAKTVLQLLRERLMADADKLVSDAVNAWRSMAGHQGKHIVSLE